MGDLTNDLNLAKEIADGFKAVDFSGVGAVTYPGQTTIPGMLSGVRLGGSLKTQFGSLKRAIDDKGAALVRIAEELAAIDEALARSLGGPS